MEFVCHLTISYSIDPSDDRWTIGYSGRSMVILPSITTLTYHPAAAAGGLL